MLYTDLRGKQFLDEKFLMSVASVGALAVGEYAEAVLVMLLYRLGELLQSIAVGKKQAFDCRPYGHLSGECGA